MAELTSWVKLPVYVLGKPIEEVVSYINLRVVEIIRITTSTAHIKKKVDNARNFSYSVGPYQLLLFVTRFLQLFSIVFRSTSFK